MRAMVLETTRSVQERPLVLFEAETPVPTPGEILVKVAACGVCHTDLHTVEGDLRLPMLPLVPGHQVVGRVVGRGYGCSRYALGDRVGVTWFFSSCGSCHFCLEGRQNLCRKAEFTGLHRNGGYAEYMVVPEQSAFPIPDSFSDAEATPLLCGGVIGYRALRLSGVECGQHLGLYGFGNSAHIVVQIAVSMGCKVAVFTRSHNHQELAKGLGAYWVGAPGTPPPDLMEASIIFAPAGELVPVALKHLERGGTVVLAGITMTQVPAFDYDLIYGERMVRSVANTTPADAEDLLKQAQAARVKTVVDTFPLDQANEVLLMMKESKLRAGAALTMV